MENPAMQEFLDMKGEIEKKVKNVPFILHKINFEYNGSRNSLLLKMWAY